jgi:hypothetical protein
MKDVGVAPWAYQELDEEEANKLQADIDRGARICIYGKPEAGKILLYNWEDCGMWILDDVGDIPLTILEYNKEQEG